MTAERQPATRPELIVAVAAKLFDEAGYSNTSMEQMAKAVGLAKPSLYHYFPSKSAILMAIHESFIDPLIEKHRGRVASGLAPREQLVGAMTDILELMETQRGYVRVFFEHHRELPKDSRRAFGKKRHLYEDLIVQTIMEGRAQGTFLVEDPRLTALAIFGMCNWAYQWWVPGSGMSPEATAQIFASMIFDGIAKHADPAAVNAVPE